MKKILVVLSLLLTTLAMGLEVEEHSHGYKDKHLIVEGRLPLFISGDRVVSKSPQERFALLTDIIKMETRRYFIEDKGDSPSSFVLKSDYQEMDNALDIRSFIVKTYYYTGGSHGMLLETPYNFRGDRELALEELFREDVNHRRLIRNRLEEIIIEEDPSLFYENISIEEEEFKYYIKDDALTILFPPYEIAPFSSGIPKFTIPLEEIREYLAPAIAAQLPQTLQ